MMADYLLFRLYGPLAAWGNIAVGERRPSFNHPGKSAIIGLLAAALGIRRHEEDQVAALAAGYSLGMRQDSPGEFLRDYHTIQVPPQRRNAVHLTRRDELDADSLNTILSTRDYRQDALYTIALWPLSGKAPYGLEDLQSALLRPRFALYLGRKSCPPALPLNPRVVEAGSLKVALDQLPARDEFLKPLTVSSKVTYYWEGLDRVAAGFSDDGVAMTEVRRDQPLSRTRWQFTDREEYHFVQDREV
jgi:CRISPR system Cascade subunit CasD